MVAFEIKIDLYYQGLLVGSSQFLMLGNQQKVYLYNINGEPRCFRNGIEDDDANWNELILKLYVRRANASWVQFYEGTPIERSMWHDDVAFTEVALPGTPLRNRRVCPLMPRDELSMGAMQLFFEATRVGDDDHEVQMDGNEVSSCRN